ncbi:MAG: mobile mystery protein B [Cyclobacteriaceae bacterium]
MGLKLPVDRGQTPLDEDEIDGLLIPTISTRQELDEYEQQNIEEALQWILKRKFKAESVLNEEFIKKLHERMYGKVWGWAGQFRKTNKNIGIDRWQISSELRLLLDDTKFWIDKKTFDPDEIAIRFKHRLVSIHCFSNGNGRHSRLMCDIIIEKIFQRPVFTWGKNLEDVRAKYLATIKMADSGDIKPLLSFSRM